MRTMAMMVCAIAIATAAAAAVASRVQLQDVIGFWADQTGTLYQIRADHSRDDGLIIAGGGAIAAATLTWRGIIAHGDTATVSSGRIRWAGRGLWIRQGLR